MKSLAKWETVPGQLGWGRIELHTQGNKTAQRESRGTALRAAHSQLSDRNKGAGGLLGSPECDG